MFHALPSMNEQIERAMNQDVTILFLAIPVGNKSAVPKSFSPYSTSLITVSGVSFEMFRDPNDTNLLSVFLSLLGVTHHLTAHPFSIQS
jgi:C4-dicarboxylate transporter